MKARIIVSVIVCVLALLGACASGGRHAPEAAAPEAPAAEPGVDPASLVGIWQGVIKAGGQEVRLVFHLDYREGAWTATADSPDQGVNGIPVDSVTLEGKKIVIDVKATAGRYEGVVQEGAASIAGKWLQGGGAFAVDLERIQVVEQIRRPQDPTPPYPYDEREVRFRNDEAGITLAGTLTVPREGGPHPAVVLVSGSGAQNRNEEIMNHRPFLVLADYLTRRGIAVLRYDDRGVPPSEGDAVSATSLDFAGDALAAFRFLSMQPGVDPSKVGIAGHSEGGLIAPMVASQHAEVAFIVLLAGPGYRGYEILLQQAAAIMRASGATTAQIDAAEGANRRIYDVILGEQDLAKAEARIREIFAGYGLKKEGVDAQVASLLSPWYRFFVAYDPTEALRRTACPVLALNGSLDLQVPAVENLSAVEKALRDGGNARVTAVKLEGLNHLFQHATTGLVQEYLQIDETFAPEAMETVARWILEEGTTR
jgi:uncharacterized protein